MLSIGESQHTDHIRRHFVSFPRPCPVTGTGPCESVAESNFFGGHFALL
jgi:hypothetical protein